MMANPTPSNTVLAQLAHFVHRIELNGESMRNQFAKLSDPVHHNSPDRVNEKTDNGLPFSSKYSDPKW